MRYDTHTLSNAATAAELSRARMHAGARRAPSAAAPLPSRPPLKQRREARGRLQRQVARRKRHQQGLGAWRGGGRSRLEAGCTVRGKRSVYVCDGFVVQALFMGLNKHVPRARTLQLARCLRVAKQHMQARSQRAAAPSLGPTPAEPAPSSPTHPRARPLAAPPAPPLPAGRGRAETTPPAPPPPTPPAATTAATRPPRPRPRRRLRRPRRPSRRCSAGAAAARAAACGQSGGTRGRGRVNTSCFRPPPAARHPLSRWLRRPERAATRRPAACCRPPGSGAPGAHSKGAARGGLSGGRARGSNGTAGPAAGPRAQQGWFANSHLALSGHRRRVAFAHALTSAGRYPSCASASHAAASGTAPSGQPYSVALRGGDGRGGKRRRAAPAWARSKRDAA